jgi:hypothetical protein
VGKAEWTAGKANPRFVVTSLGREEHDARHLYEKLYCARGEMENRIKECQLDLYADRTSAHTMGANQLLRLWFASMSYVLVCALRRIGLVHNQFACVSRGTIRLKLPKIVALVHTSVRRIKLAAGVRAVVNFAAGKNIDNGFFPAVAGVGQQPENRAVAIEAAPVRRTIEHPLLSDDQPGGRVCAIDGVAATGRKRREIMDHGIGP